MKRKSSAPARKNPLKEKIQKLERQALAAERLRFESVRKVHTDSSETFDAATFIAGIAHEFNNILGAAEGHADWGLESDDPKEMKEALEIVRTACRRSAEITKGLSVLLQPREEAQSLFSVSSILQELEALFRPRAEKEGVRLEISPVDAQIYGDSTRFLEVLVNLVKNSFEAFLMETASQKVTPQISVKCLTKSIKRKPFVRIEVRDNGPGIEDFVAEKLFRPFFTTKGTLSKALFEEKPPGNTPASVNGSGLGLYLSRRIIEEHGGQIRRLRQKNGAAFEILLPRVS